MGHLITDEGQAMSTRKWRVVYIGQYNNAYRPGRWWYGVTLA